MFIYRKEQLQFKLLNHLESEGIFFYRIFIDNINLNVGRQTDSFEIVLVSQWNYRDASYLLPEHS